MRAKRRHHYERLKKKRSSYWGGMDRFDPQIKERRRGQVVSAPACNGDCDCCCNQRRIEGPTRQERKHELQLKEYAG